MKPQENAPDFNPLDTGFPRAAGPCACGGNLTERLWSFGTFNDCDACDAWMPT
ncbi:hypothetical protein [Litorimonas sp. WD9-15]|uniref:hypothetical protein n=1 Tax=Litorimonas sp. WD9-15 TaxID=3418716 RepID=UPI003D0670F9